VVQPELPAVAEFIPGFEASTWFGLGAPKGTPVEIIDRLNKEVVTALRDSKTSARFSELGSEALIGSPADFGKLIVDETEKWGRVIRSANIKAE
jgi:tripartite-type tricarboxylate transporter receptor subunit TctC